MFTLQPYSSARRVAVSASICWLMVTIMPMPMSLEISSEPFRFILRASSETVITSMMEISLGMGLARATCFFLTWRDFSRTSSRFLMKGFLLALKNFLEPPFLASSSEVVPPPGAPGRGPGRGPPGPR